MRLSSKIIEEVISEVAGDDVIPLVNLLKNKKNISEFKLAEATKQEVNRVRNMLYRLYDSNLVSFVRKKDKKKGWYIYYWTFNNTRVKDLIKTLKMQRLKKLEERLKRESQGQFYSCDNKCIRLDFDQSINFEFKCPECGELIHLEDNTKYINKIKEEITEIEQEIKDIEEDKKKKIEKKIKSLAKMQENVAKAKRGRKRKTQKSQSKSVKKRAVKKKQAKTKKRGRPSKKSATKGRKRKKK